MLDINPQNETDYSQDFETVAVRNTLIDEIKTTGSHGQTVSYKIGDINDENVEERAGLTLVDLKNSSQFNWDVAKVPIADQYEGNSRKVKNVSMMVRQDTKRQLGLIRGRVKPLQNHHLFDFLQPFEDSGNFELETAASLDGGRTVIALMRNRSLGDVEITKGDSIGAYLYAKMTRNSKPSIQVGEMLMRLVCSNGMIGFKPDVYTIDQNSMSLLNLNNVQHLIQKNLVLTQRAADKMKEMVAVKITGEQQLDNYWRQSMGFVWDDPSLTFESEEEEDEHRLAMKKNKRTMNKLEQCYESQRETLDEQYQDTVWHAYQGNTAYTTHERSKSPNSRFKSILGGKGQAINHRSFQLACQLVDAAA
jgi:phage/plasmid-like protein (TIGR03299 family)